MRISNSGLMAWFLCLCLTACGVESPQQSVAAPGAPGAPSFWADARKTGVGTSYESYVDSAFSDDAETGVVSRVWFSIAQGMLTETMYGLIHEAQIRDLRFVVTGDGFVDGEADDMDHVISYLDTDDEGRPLAPAYVIESRDKDGLYTLTKTILTDPDRQALIVRVRFDGAPGQSLHMLLNPHIGNTGGGDYARASTQALRAYEGERYLSLFADNPFDIASAGFVGISDGDADLADNGVLDWSYSTTGETPGNVALSARLMTPDGRADHLISIGFGESRAAADSEAQGALEAGFDDIRARYLGDGAAVGWTDYLDSLETLSALQALAADGGALTNASALVLKIQEDKTYAGALIASLSNPWGQTASAEASSSGYKAVWPRDFYQVAMALLALGDEETAATSFRYLPKVQVTEDTPGNEGATGWFMQKTRVNGDMEWVAVQLDQTAMPIMLGWRLWRAGALSDDEIATYFESMLKPAADFLVDGGTPHLLYNTDSPIDPPFTQQERWEEQYGYSPSTTAAVIAGLIAAADMAETFGDEMAAVR